jgi:hypothetical protein
MFECRPIVGNFVLQDFGSIVRRAGQFRIDVL